MNTQELETFYNELADEYGEKVIALAQHLELDLEPNFDADDYPTEDYTDEEIAEEKQKAIDEVKDRLISIHEGYGEYTYEYCGEEYIVATDEEADEIEDEKLDDYLEECIYPELPENLRFYFDDDAWKRDARMDGRGHIISTYDGDENYVYVNGTAYYIYRTN